MRRAWPPAWHAARPGSSWRRADGCGLTHAPTLARVVRSNRDEAVGVGPLTQFLLKLLTLVHQDLPIVSHGHLEAFQGTRGRPFKVDSRDVKPAAVARALEFLFVCQPVGRTAQVGTDRLERVNDVLTVVPRG